MLSHPSLAENWKKLTLPEQLANIGSEVIRSLNWKKKNKPQLQEKAFYRALELFDLTLAEKRVFSQYKEIARARELYGEYLSNETSTDQKSKAWEKYFVAFTYLARKNQNQ